MAQDKVVLPHRLPFVTSGHLSMIHDLYPMKTELLTSQEEDLGAVVNVFPISYSSSKFVMAIGASQNRFSQLLSCEREKY